MDIVAFLDSLGGIGTRQQVIAAGFTGYDLTRAVRTGSIARVRQARYATPNAPRDAVLATRVGGLLAGTSAADSYGLWSGLDTRLHISVGANSSRLRTNVPPRFREGAQSLTPDNSGRRIVVHWLRDGAVPELGPQCWRVTLPVCLRQVVRWAERETALACLDTALTVGKLSIGRVNSFFVGAHATDILLVAQARSGSDSGTESLVRQRLSAMDIRFRQQVEIPGVGRVDFGIVGTRIVIEIDSRKHHDDPTAFERDRWRDGELVARGYVVIRLTYDKVTSNWAWCRGIILAAIDASPI